MRITGRVWKFGDNINTDLIYPNVALNLSAEERWKWVFSANRPGWVEQVESGDIIVGGCNFGTGSARPGAVVFQELKLGGLVAHSINGVFFRNCINYGFPALQCAGVAEAFEEGDVAEIDLEAGTVKNLRSAQMLQGVKLPQAMVKIIEAGGIVPLLRKEGYLD